MKVSVDGQCLSAPQTPTATRRLVWEMLVAFAHSSGGVEMETLTLDRAVAAALRQARIRARKIQLPPPRDRLVPSPYAQRVNEAFRAAWLDSPPDVILLPELTSPEVALVEPFAGIPTVAVMCAPPREQADGRYAFELAMQRLERLRRAGTFFLVTSLLLRDWLTVNARVPAERIETLPPPVDLRRFFAREGQTGPDFFSQAEPAPFILAQACEETVSTLPALFHAFAQLPTSLRRIGLKVAVDRSDSRLMDAVQRAATDEGVAAERWEWADADETSFSLLLREARVFLYPAEEDYIGAPLLQAMASGCAVICSDTGALPELAGTAALTASPFDAEALGDRLARMLRQRQEREAWAARGPQRARKYGGRQCAARLAQTFYQEHREEAALSGDLRVAFATPFPPPPSGVAQYSKLLAGELREYADVDLYVPDLEQVDPVLRTRFHIFPADELPTRFGKYDVAVYSMAADYDQYRGLFALLGRLPGVVIMHDASLRDFFLGARGPQAAADGQAFRLRSLGLGSGQAGQAPRHGSLRHSSGQAGQAAARLEGDPFYEEMRYCYGEAGAEAARRALIDGEPVDQRLAFLNHRVTRRSRGVVAHSRWAARRLLENGDPPPILALPHGLPVDPQFDQVAGREFRESLRERGGRLFIGALGPFDESRRLHVLLRAVAQLRDHGRRPLLALIGRQTAAVEAQCRLLAAQLDLGRLIVPVDRPEPHDAFLGHLAALDAVVDLRCPDPCEVSNAAWMALALGKPLFLTDAPAVRELPREAAFRIAADDLEIPMLAAALEGLVERIELREGMIQAARAYAAKVAAWPIVARRFCQFLYEVARRYRYAPPSE
ncbi:MAG: glycosyltransferase [Candidatus Sumerlaeota bacterium]|nr:glycosyltransferase [Candidatus Sumerlaeota bacterium]